MATPQLELSRDEDAIVITMANLTKSAIAIVTHPRYVSVEVKNERGHFITGDGAVAAAFPSASDYVKIDAGQRHPAFRLALKRTEEGLHVGAIRFTTAPKKAAVRVTYKADAMMPNMPRKMQRDFVRGPLVSGTITVEV